MSELSDHTRDDDARHARSGPQSQPPSQAATHELALPMLESLDGAGPTLEPAGPSAGDPTQRTPASLMGDPRLRRSMYDRPRADLYLQMQGTYGNAYVRRLQKSTSSRTLPAQRVPIGVSSGFDETLLQSYTPATATQAQRNTPGTYHPNDYSQSGQYQLDRLTTENKVRVNIRIQYYDPIPTSPFKQEIPATDTRRNWVRDHKDAIVRNWNNKFKLVGHRLPPAPSGPAPAAPAGSGAPTPAAPAPVPVPLPTTSSTSTSPAPATPPSPGATPASPTSGEISLPIEFNLEPVWSLTGTHDQEIALHSEAADDTTADPTAEDTRTHGRGPDLRRKGAINSGNWYMDTHNYGTTSPDIIYAHEYGHLLGIPDEYSQSNPQMHALFHKISPTEETQMNRAMDRAGSRQILLAALAPAIQKSIRAISNGVDAEIRAQHALLEHKLSEGLQQSWAVHNIIERVISILSASHASPRVLDAVERSFENKSKHHDFDRLVRGQVARELSPANFRTLLQSAYGQTFMAAYNAGTNVNIPYVNDAGTSTQVNVSIETSGSGRADPALS